MKKNIFLTGLLFIFICIAAALPSPAYAKEAEPMVRVGLTERFGQKDSIVLKNTMLTCGYWSVEKDGFHPCEVFTSKGGFTFVPFEKTCYVSEVYFQSYEEAAAAAGKCSNAGVLAYPAILHENYWKIYVVGTGEDSAAAAKLGFSNFYLSTITIRYRILVSGSFGSFLIDVDDARNYPMFTATSSNARGDYIINVEEKAYRGYMEIGRYGKAGVTAVNILPMEQYLYGVVPSEVSYTWPKEMLKAQAVAARSYAAAQDTIGPSAHISSGGYALTDTTASQAYGGYTAERRATTAAVDETKNEKLYYRNMVIKAYYFSASGGSTEDAQSVWNVPISYFQQTADVTELNPAKKPWIVTYKISKLTSILSQEGYSIGNLRKMIPEIVTESGRIYSLRLIGTKGAASLKKTEISSVLELPSTKFKVIAYGDVPDRVWVQGADKTGTVRISDSYLLSAGSSEPKKAGSIEQYVVMGADNLMNYPRKAPTDADTYYLAGMGYGHGVGMSQSGAASLAQEGYDYKQILLHYYKDVEIK